MEIMASVPIDSIYPHPENCRLHDEVNINLIMKSIGAFGLYKPLVVQKSTNFIIAGNGTYKACKNLGNTSVEVVYVDVDDDKARCMAIADNRTSELSEWNLAALLDCTKNILDASWQESMQFDRKFMKRLERIVNKPPPMMKPVVSDDAIKFTKRIITCPNCGKTYEK